LADGAGAEPSATAHGTLVRRDAAVADPYAVVTGPAAAAAAAADADDEAWELDAAIGAVVASHGSAGAAPSASASDDTPRPAARSHGFAQDVARSFSQRPPRPGALLRAPADVAPRMDHADALADDGDPAASAEAVPVRKAGPRPSRLPGQLGRRATIPEFHFGKPSAHAADAPTRPSAEDDDPLAPALFGEPLDWSGAKKRHRRGDAVPPSVRPVRADAAGAPPADGEAGGAGGHDYGGEAGGHGYGDPAEVDADWNLDAEIAAIATSHVTGQRGEEPDDGRLPSALAQHADAVTKHSHQRRRAFLIGGGLLALAVLGTVGLVGYGALGGGGGDGEPLIVRADPDGLKVFPDSDDAADADLAFDGRLADLDSEDGELVITETPEIGIEPAPFEPGSEEDVLRSRLVRTVVVRPDGTIVRGGAPRGACW
jgi:hypothetical protein